MGIPIRGQIRSGSGYEKLFTRQGGRHQCHVLDGVEEVEIQISLDGMLGDLADLVWADLFDEGSCGGGV